MKSHVLALHCALPFAGVGHAVAHDPQCSAFVVRSTQAPLHTSWPAGHVEPQAPFPQTRPELHPVPQPRSCRRSLGVDLAAVLRVLQSALPDSHDATTQAPAFEHAALP